VTYAYDHATLWRLKAASEVAPLGGHLVVAKSLEEECETSPELNITTRCASFRLQAVAPVAGNKWALLGEPDKFIPVSNQRIASITALAGGGFKLTLKGAPGENVTVGAVDLGGSKAAPVYASVTIGGGGTAALQLR
jgi:hypothetical protein